MYQIYSQSYTSGTMYDGEFTFNRYIPAGLYKISQIYHNLDDFVFMSSETNGFTYSYGYSDDPEYSEQRVFFDDETIGNSTDKTAIATSMQNTFDQNIITAGISNLTITVVYNSVTDNIEISFASGVYDKFTILWSDSESTSAVAFGKESTDEILTGSDVTFLINLEYSIDFIPKFLEVYISEAKINTITSSLNTNPTLVLSLLDGEFTNQYFQISTATKTLNLSIRNPLLSTTRSYPISGYYIISFQIVQ